jgi:hypothetical protein
MLEDQKLIFNEVLQKTMQLVILSEKAIIYSKKYSVEQYCD